MKTRLIGAAVLAASLGLWIWFYQLVHGLTPQNLQPLHMIISFAGVATFAVGSAMVVLGGELFRPAGIPNHWTEGEG